MYLDTHQQHTFEIEDFIGERIAVLGISGSGKTNTVAVIIESLIEHIPMTIIDIEGEYWGLKAQFNLVIAGASDHADIPLTEGNAAALARWSYQNRISVVLDLSDTHEEEMFYIVENYLNALWIISKNKQPYMLVVEECHEFMPQNGKTPTKDLISRIAKRGRKRGLGIILSSQRSASVDKNILTQAGLFFLHQVKHPIEIAVYKGLIPLPPKDVTSKVPALKTGQAILISNHQPRMIQVKSRATFHAGFTPGLSAEELPVLRTVSSDLLDSLKQMMKTSVDTPRDQTQILQSKINQQDELIAELKTTIGKQAKEIHALCAQIESLTAPVQTLLPLDIDDNNPEDRTEDRTAAIQSRLDANRKRIISRQRSGFNRFINQLKSLDKRYLFILSWLIDHPDAAYTIDDIKLYTAYTIDSLPSILSKLKLLKRTKKGRYNYYQTIAEDTLQSTFPDLELLTLLEEIHALSK